MTVAVEIKGLKEAEKFLKMFPEEARRVHTLALNRAAVNAKTAAVQGITETYTITPAAVLKDLSLHRATKNNPVAIFRSSGRPRSLGHFNTRNETASGSDNRLPHTLPSPSRPASSPVCRSATPA